MKQMRVRYKISADLIERNQFMCYSYLYVVDEVALLTSWILPHLVYLLPTPLPASKIILGTRFIFISYPRRKRRSGFGRLAWL